MRSTLILSLLALHHHQAQADFQTDADHGNDMTETVRATSGYSLDDFHALVDTVLDACDSNGCDGATQKCNDVHCLAIDGDNLDDDHDNVLDIVGQYVKAAMATADTVLDDCTSAGCGFLDAVNYTIPAYVSLRRNYADTGAPNVLYKISITTEDAKDACGAVFDALSAASSGLDGPDLFGAIKVAVCSE